MNEPSLATRNRTLLIVLAAIGLFVGGCLTGFRLGQLYSLWNVPARPRLPQMAIVDGDAHSGEMP